MDELVRRTYKLIVYASMSNAVDTTDQEASKRNNQAQSMAARVFASVAFFDPELLTIGKETLDQWLTKEAGLTEMQHYVDSLFRRQAHAVQPRSKSCSDWSPIHSKTFSIPSNMLSNSDFKFAPAVALDGSTVQVTASTFDNLMNSPGARRMRHRIRELYRCLPGLSQCTGEQSGDQREVDRFPTAARAITSLAWKRLCLTTISLWRYFIT